jgi:hypothetical protein
VKKTRQIRNLEPRFDSIEAEKALAIQLFRSIMARRCAGVVAILVASFPGVVSAKVDCGAVPQGPARTDCYLGLSQFYRGQSDVAVAKARVQSDTARYREIAGTDNPKHKRHRRK